MELEEPLLSVVKHLRKNVPAKNAQIKKQKVEYVSGILYYKSGLHETCMVCGRLEIDRLPNERQGHADWRQ